MAGTLEINVAEQDLTLTAKLFALGSDILAETIALTEETNREGLYTGAVVGALDGLYHCHVFDGSARLIFSGYVSISNAAVVHRAGDAVLGLYLAVAALLDLADGVETGWTVREALRVLLAGEAGKVSGAATETITIRDVNDTTDRIVATVDASGNRTAVTLDAS